MPQGIIGIQKRSVGGRGISEPMAHLDLCLKYYFCRQSFNWYKIY